MLISVIVRRLREGKTYEDFRRAWLPDKGFGVPTRVITGQGADDERDIINIGFVDLSEDQTQAFLARIGPQEHVRHDRIDEVVEPGMTRTFYIQVADDDLTEAPQQK